LPPAQRVDAGISMRTSFKMNFRRMSTGILMYELRGKDTGQFDGNTISREDGEKRIQIFIIWKVNAPREFCVYSFLIEHDSGRIWDRDKLMELAKRHTLHDMQHGPIEYTCLVHDNTVLGARVNAAHDECYKLKVTIFEINIKDDTWRPWYIDVDR
jgi:hypothetical protein